MPEFSLSSQAEAADASARRHLRHAVAAATIGTALEWFDLVVYGFFALTIAKLFFPAGNPLTSLLLTLGTFGASYLMRPLGALFLGAYADRHGRKRGLTLSIALMALGTLIIAVAPTYEAIGVAAPALMVAARLIQGISAGGEFGSSTSFLVEHSPPAQRGFYASFQMAAQGATAVLASLFGVMLTRSLSTDQLLAWGWRIPFLFGLTIIPVAYFIRRHVSETPVFLNTSKAHSPVRETFADNKLRLMLAIGVYILVTSSSYVIILFMPTFAVRQLGIPSSIAFTGTLLMGAIQIIACPIAGALADRAGRLRVLLWAAVIFGVSVVPLFALLAATPTMPVFLALCVVLGLLVSAYQGPIPAVLSELFPARVRTLGLALTHNLTVAVFGGFAPMILTWAISRTHSNLAPAAYIAAAALLSVMCLVICMRRYGARPQLD